jgi:predicted O-methyltransferase YrrM
MERHPKTDAAPVPSFDKVMERLEKMRATESGMMNVSPEEGAFLRDLVVELDARKVVEIGTSNGYSGIWFSLGLRKTGGQLITLDTDAGRYDLAQQNFRATGLSEIIDSRLSDALTELSIIEGPLDLVFIDAWKPDYSRYLELALPKVRSGGVIAAHNVDSHRDELAGFIAQVENHHDLTTEFVRRGPGGMTVSYRK